MSTQKMATLFQQLAAAEQSFMNQEFLAPAIRGGKVNVRIAGVLLRMQIEPSDFRGWGVFLPITHSNALLVREATLAERQRYLSVTRSTSMVLHDRIAGTWNAVSAHQGQGSGVAPVYLVEGAELFDRVKVRSDGANYWYDGIDRSGDAATAAWLRRSLETEIAPQELRRKGLTSQQRLAYTLKYFSRIEAQKIIRQDEVESQLREALSHAGSTLEGYVEHRDGFRVTYLVGGRRHVSSVNKDDLTVQVAGICLNGEDRKFDLTSLVGVMKESLGENPVVVGTGGMTESEYWAIHPRQ